MEDERETSSLRHRRRKSSMSLSFCFHGHRLESFDSSSPAASPSPSPSLRRSPSAWFRSRAQEIPEIKGKCKNLISKMGRHRRHSSADFSYDPLSYALNFNDDDDVDDIPARNFTARLPLSPPRAGSLELRRNVESLTTRVAAMELRRNVEVPTRKAAGLELRRNVEVPTPKGKMETARLPLSSPKPRGASAAVEARRSIEVPPPVMVSRPSREILVKIC